MNIASDKFLPSNDSVACAACVWSLAFWMAYTFRLLIVQIGEFCTKLSFSETRGRSSCGSFWTEKNQMVAVEPWMHFLDDTDVHNRGSVNSQEFARIKFSFESVKSLANFISPYANIESSLISNGLIQSISFVFTRTIRPFCRTERCSRYSLSLRRSSSIVLMFWLRSHCDFSAILRFARVSASVKRSCPTGFSR